VRVAANGLTIIIIMVRETVVLGAFVNKTVPFLHTTANIICDMKRLIAICPVSTSLDKLQKSFARKCECCDPW
jgi:hypothetical protein